MSGIKRILFPIDLSATSARVAGQVEEIAMALGAEIHVLVVRRLEDTPKTGGYSPGGPPPAGPGENGPDSTLDRFIKKHLPYSRCQRDVVTGSPVVKIIDYAYERAIDLIVMPVGPGPEAPGSPMERQARDVRRACSLPVLTIGPEDPLESLSQE